MGRALDAATATPAQVRDALRVVLTDPPFRTAAEAVRAEVAAPPGAERAAQELERLARQGLS